MFPCRDGWIGVTVLTPKQWHAFCKRLDLEAFAGEPLFQSAAARFEAADLLEPLFTEKLLEFSAEELFYRGQAAAIPLARARHRGAVGTVPPVPLATGAGRRGAGAARLLAVAAARGGRKSAESVAPHR